MCKKHQVFLAAMLAMMMAMTGCGSEQNKAKDGEAVQSAIAESTTSTAVTSEPIQATKSKIKATEKPKKTSKPADDTNNAEQSKAEDKQPDQSEFTESPESAAANEESVQMLESEAQTPEATQNVQYEERNLIEGYYVGMNLGEAVSLLDESLIYSSPTVTYSNDDKSQFIIDLGNEPPLETDMRSSMFIEVDAQNAVIRYGYLIGCSVDSDKQEVVYPYTIDELTAEYNEIYKELCTWYGEGSESDIELSFAGVVDYTQWYSENYGHIEYFFGEDLFVEIGKNVIFLQIS